MILLWLLFPLIDSAFYNWIVNIIFLLLWIDAKYFYVFLKFSVFDYSIQIDTYQSIAGNLPFIVIEPLSIHMLYKQQVSFNESVTF